MGKNLNYSAMNTYLVLYNNQKPLETTTATSINCDVFIWNLSHSNVELILILSRLHSISTCMYVGMYSDDMLVNKVTKLTLSIKPVYVQDKNNVKVSIKNIPK